MAWFPTMSQQTSVCGFTTTSTTRVEKKSRTFDACIIESADIVQSKSTERQMLATDWLHSDKYNNCCNW